MTYVKLGCILLVIESWMGTLANNCHCYLFQESNN